ncbi:hypothetical protein Tco_0907502 [Tanacetum coccineum]|uniref:Uncharacterized protein n=1 Tax=Tanacetum coccineum TaxID=301880 RepID=A0ABQ5CMC2_9ASTR
MKRGLIISNKARLVDNKGYRQEEGVDYDDKCLHTVARIEAIRLLFGFLHLSWASLSTELSGTSMALHQATEHVFYGEGFEDLMQKKFKMSSMGELTFFLGLQVKQTSAESFSDSDYAGDNHDRRSTSGGCQYLGRRLVSWQCKKQTIVAISSTEAEYVAAASFFTFMRKHSPKFSCRITPLTPSMLEVVTALAAEEEHSTSPHSRAASSARDAQGTPTQSAAHSQGTASVQGTASFHGTAEPQDSDEVQGTNTLQGTAAYQGTAAIPNSPNDYTPTDASQTSGGVEGY